MLDILSSGWFITSVFGVALLYAAWRYYDFYRKNFPPINDEIKNILDLLNTEQEFEDINAEFKKHTQLLPVWKMFEKSLTIADNKAYSTIDAAEIFSPQNFTRGMNITFWQAYGGIFTGLGILGTFAGLTIGLTGIDMTGGDIETLKNGIANLLSGVKTAFVTSLVGISCAIIYSGVHHKLMKDFQGNVNALADKLDEIFPRHSAEDWLADNNRIISDQTNSVKEIGEIVTEAIYNGLDEKLGEAVVKLDPLVERICAAIKNLGSDGTDRIGEIFSDRVGSQMDRFSAALDNFSNSIDNKLKTADEISKIMSEQLLSTLNALNDSLTQQAKTSAAERNADYKTFSDTMGNLIGDLKTVGEQINSQQENTANNFAKLVEDLKNFFQEQKSYLGDIATDNAAQISKAVDAFREIIDRHNDTTQRTFNQIQKLLTETETFLELMDEASTSLKQAAEPVRQSTLQLTTNLAETSAQMNTLANANRVTRENLFDLSTKLKSFTDNFDGIADELERSTKIIHDSLDNYNVKTNAGLAAKFETFDKLMNQAFGYFNEIVEELSVVAEDLQKVHGR